LADKRARITKAVSQLRSIGSTIKFKLIWHLFTEI